MLKVLWGTRVQQFLQGFLQVFLNYLLPQTISTSISSTSHNTKTQHLKSHASTHEISIKYHPTVIQCHHDKYHPKHYTLEEVVVSRGNFTTSPIFINPQFFSFNFITVELHTFTFESHSNHNLNNVIPTSSWWFKLPILFLSSLEFLSSYH